MYNLTDQNQDTSGGHWKFDNDYVVRTWVNRFGDNCVQKGNVWVERVRNSAGGFSTKETFVCTQDQ